MTGAQIAAARAMLPATKKMRGASSMLAGLRMTTRVKLEFKLTAPSAVSENPNCGNETWPNSRYAEG